MSSKSIKKEFRIPAAGFDLFLNDLISGFEKVSKEAAAEPTADISSFSKFELSMKQKGDEIIVKIKGKCREAGSEDEESEPTADCAEENKPMEYKELKKRMKKLFKTISTAVKKKELPDAATVDAFLEASKIMMNFRGKGDELYAEYTAACMEFQAAFEDKDLDALREAQKKLDATRKEAHGRFKNSSFTS